MGLGWMGLRMGLHFSPNSVGTRRGSGSLDFLLTDPHTHTLFGVSCRDHFFGGGTREGGREL